MKRRIISLVLVLALTFSMIPVSHAAVVTVQEAADALYTLGLFSGTDKGYELYRAPRRDEALTMLVALLGKAETARNGIWFHPFTDVDAWASPYVGYAYVNGITSGISTTKFGSTDPVTATQYLTFVLSALGYRAGVDYQWDKAYLFSDQIGLTKGQYNANSLFLRGDVALISYAALWTKNKAGKLLVDVLVDQGAVSAADLAKLDGYEGGVSGQTHATVSSITPIDLSLVKIGNQYYLISDDELRIRYYYAQRDNKLLIFAEDIRVEKAVNATSNTVNLTPASWRLNYLLRLVLLESYSVKYTDHKYASGALVMDRPLLFSDNILGYGAGEAIDPTTKQTYQLMWYEYDGKRVYSLPTNSKGFTEVNSIRYFDTFICLNDLLEHWEITATFEVGQYHGMNYIELVK